MGQGGRPVGQGVHDGAAHVAAGGLAVLPPLQALGIQDGSVLGHQLLRQVRCILVEVLPLLTAPSVSMEPTGTKLMLAVPTMGAQPLCWVQCILFEVLGLSLLGLSVAVQQPHLCRTCRGLQRDQMGLMLAFSMGRCCSIVIVIYCFEPRASCLLWGSLLVCRGVALLRGTTAVCWMAATNYSS